MKAQIGNRYQIGEKLGEGGMGTVYKGLDRETQRTVAIKHLDPEMSDPEMIARFQREGEALRDLAHPNIVQLLDMIEEDEVFYLIIEYFPNGDLSKLLEEGPLPIEQAISMGIEIADALTRAHHLQIIHRDLKPSNILIAEDGTPRLSDFGIAYLINQDTLTDSDSIIGTLEYLAPEVLKGETIDTRADIWAFGVLLFEMLSGTRPFTGNSPANLLMNILTASVPDLQPLCPDAPVALVDLIYRMLDKDRYGRIRSIRQIGLELEDMRDGRTIVTPTQTRFALPTPRSLGTSRSNIPAQTTPFVGRESELSEMKNLLQDPQIRLVTIVAPGGMGKTRLALELGQHFVEGTAQHQYFANGVYFVELAPLSHPEHIAPAIAEAIGYHVVPDGRDPAQQVRDLLVDKEMLLILDNFEHLLEDAPLVTEMLSAAPRLKILTTSRQRLNQSGETIFILRGMDFPDLSDPDEALEYAAIKLFMQGAKRSQPQFKLRPENLSAVTKVCRLVHGLPLGILLAASWVGMLTPEEIIPEIEQGIDFLASGMSDLPERHRSIRAIFDYSWNLMTAEEQQVFMQLSIFRGGFTRRAAQNVTGASLQVLMNLMNKSLILRDVDSGRYDMHGLLIQYAQEYLHERDDAEAIYKRHAEHYLQGLHSLQEDLKGHRQLTTLNIIEADFENVRVAWEYASKASLFDLLYQAGECLYWFCYMRSRPVESQALFGIALQALPVDTSYEAMRVNFTLFHGFTREHQIDAVTLDDCQRVAEKHDNQGDLALCMTLRARNALVSERDFEQAIIYYQQALDHYRMMYADFYVAWIMHRIGFCYVNLGQIEQFAAYTQKSLTLRTNIHDEIGASHSLGNLGIAHLMRDQYQQGLESLKQAITIASRYQFPYEIAFIRGSLSWAYFVGGDYQQADEEATHARELGREVGYLGSEAWANIVLSFVANRRGFYTTGEQLANRALIQTIQTNPALIPRAHLGIAVALCGLGRFDELDHHLGLAFDALITRYALPLVGIGAAVRALQFHAKCAYEQAAICLGYCLGSGKQVFGWMQDWSPLIDLKTDLVGQMGEDAFKAAYATGQALDLTQVVNEWLL